MNEKNQRLLWDPYGVLQWMQKTNDYYGTLYTRITMNEKPMSIMGPYVQILQWMKTSDYYGTLYVGIAMNVKNQWLLRDLICGYCIECK